MINLCSEKPVTIKPKSFLCVMMCRCDITSFPLGTFRESLLRGLLGDRSFEPGTGAIHCILDEHTVTQDRD